MDREVVEQKLESLRRCLKRIETKCPANAEILMADCDLQDIIALNLSRAPLMRRHRRTHGRGHGRAAT
jgi:hypothetical protein